MKLKYFKVDSFTNELFKGNPACVVPLSEWLDVGQLYFFLSVTSIGNYYKI